MTVYRLKSLFTEGKSDQSSTLADGLIATAIDFRIDPSTMSTKLTTVAIPREV